VGMTQKTCAGCDATPPVSCVRRTLSRQTRSRAFPRAHVSATRARRLHDVQGEAARTGRLSLTERANYRFASSHHTRRPRSLGRGGALQSVAGSGMAGSGVGAAMTNPMGNVQQQQGGVKSVPDLPNPQLPLQCVVHLDVHVWRAAHVQLTACSLCQLAPRATGATGAARARGAARGAAAARGDAEPARPVRRAGQRRPLSADCPPALPRDALRDALMAC
jgi:hypothetical protein